MNGIIYLVGLIVVIGVILSFLGLRWRSEQIWSYSAGNPLLSRSSCAHYNRGHRHGGRPPAAGSWACPRPGDLARFYDEPAPICPTSKINTVARVRCSVWETRRPCQAHAFSSRGRPYH